MPRDYLPDDFHVDVDLAYDTTFGAPRKILRGHVVEPEHFLNNLEVLISSAPHPHPTPGRASASVMVYGEERQFYGQANVESCYFAD